MKKLLLSLSLVLSALPSLASAATTKDFDDMLVEGRKFDITGRYVRGELNDRIIKIHLVTIKDIDGTVVENRDIPSEEANHRALRKHSDCSLNPTTCKSQAVR